MLYLIYAFFMHYDNTHAIYIIYIEEQLEVRYLSFYYFIVFFFQFKGFVLPTTWKNVIQRVPWLSLGQGGGGGEAFWVH